MSEKKWWETFDRFMKNGIQVDVFTSGKFEWLLRTVTKINK